jgi:hypothetical protein
MQFNFFMLLIFDLVEAVLEIGHTVQVIEEIAWFEIGARGEHGRMLRVGGYELFA